MDANSYANFDMNQSESKGSETVISFKQKSGLRKSQVGQLLLSEVVTNFNDFEKFKRKTKSFKHNETVEYNPFTKIKSASGKKHQARAMESHWDIVKVRRNNFFKKQDELVSLMNTMFLREDANWKFDYQPAKNSKSSTDFLSKPNG